MNYKIPSDLIFKNSHIKISYEENTGLNKTKNSIILEGTRGGFLSLSNTITYLLNDLQDIIQLDLISYVSADIELTIECDESLNGTAYGEVVRKKENQFLWKMSDSEACKIASEIHSLGHINKELHFDEGKNIEEISIYCVLN